MNIKWLLSLPEALTKVGGDIVSYNSQYVIRTRKQPIISCRMWQLILAVLNDTMLEVSYGSQEYYDIIAGTQIVFDHIKHDSENSVMYSLIYLNQNMNDAIVAYDLNSTLLNVGNNYLCIYLDNEILHYFTVIKTVNNEYYLNSAYASDYVCVPQYTSLIQLKELNRFVSALCDLDTYVSEFFRKFFLKGNIGVRYSKDVYEMDSSLRYKSITPEQGIQKEIEVITKNMYRDRMRCGIIVDYERLVLGCDVSVSSLSGSAMSLISEPL